MAKPNLRDLNALADLMDQKFRGPFGWRFGLDGLIGLIPIVGDMFTNLISAYLILRAAQLGCPPSVILRMGLNLLVENVIDVIPLLGNLFDFVWKANVMNMRLVERYFEDPRAVRGQSRFVVALVIALVFISMLGLLALSVLTVKWLWVQMNSGGWS